MSQELAFFGGEPVRKKAFPKLPPIGPEEKKAVNEVLDSNVLSAFAASWSDRFYGGPRVQRLEREWEKCFQVKYAVAMNSATSCLQAAVAAAGVGPGDEVIVTPYSMIASATCVFITGAVPVFADIDERTLCITAKTIRPCITPRTKAIIIVQLFGHTEDMDAVMALAKEFNLVVIEDAAQSLAGTFKGQLSGTFGHMGVYSLNVHKTISSGEGGIVVTRDQRYAERLQLFRNHGDAVMRAKGTQNLVNTVGFNMRMCEIEAAIAFEQLKKLETLTVPRIEAANFLNVHLSRFPGIIVPYTCPEVRHVYYNYGLKIDADKLGLSREILVQALFAEGVPFLCGFFDPIYHEPIFQEKIVWGNKGFPWSCKTYGDVDRDYPIGLCPTVERIEGQELIYNNLCRAGMTRRDLQDIVDAFDKVIANKAKLKTSPSGNRFCCGKQRCGRPKNLTGEQAKVITIHEMQKTHS